MIRSENNQAAAFVERRRNGLEKRWYQRLWSLASKSDTAPTQFFLAMTAMLVAATLLGYGESLARPSYHYLQYVAGVNADEKWAVVFIVFAVLEICTTLTSGHPKISLAVNLFGAALFMVIPIAIYWDPVEPPPLIGPMSLSVALAAGWVAVLTNNKPIRGWRSD